MLGGYPSANSEGTPLHEPIQAEPFGIEYLEQHAASLAAAQVYIRGSEWRLDPFVKSWDVLLECLLDKSATSSRPVESVKGGGHVLLYFARDAVVAITYVGLAYTDGRPTDEWLAERIWGKPLVHFEGGTPAWGFRPPPGAVDIGCTVRNLKNELESLQPSRLVHLIIAGWQWGHKGIARPTLIALTSGVHEFEIWRAPRYWYYQRPQPNAFQTCTIALPSGYLTQADLTSMRQQLESQGPDRAEEVLVDWIRKAAEGLGQGKVGRDCMSVRGGEFRVGAWRVLIEGPILPGPQTSVLYEPQTRPDPPG